jgi:hypothetical protein
LHSIVELLERQMGTQRGRNLSEKLYGADCRLKIAQVQCAAFIFSQRPKLDEDEHVQRAPRGIGNGRQEMNLQRLRRNRPSALAIVRSRLLRKGTTTPSAPELP